MDWWVSSKRIPLLTVSKSNCLALLIIPRVRQVFKNNSNHNVQLFVAYVCIVSLPP